MIASCQRGILSIATQQEPEVLDCLGKKVRPTRGQITFDDDDLNGNSKPHNDALMVTLRIGGFLVKRVMINQGSGFEIMYPDLYKGLGLKPEDLGKYNTPLVGFDKKMVVSKGQIELLVVA